jgi:ADP-heptose:LPS heptosyltransferase
MSNKNPVIKSIERGFKGLTRTCARRIYRNAQVSLPLSWNKVRSILILRNDKIGDMVVTLPLFNILKENKPDLRLAVLASPVNSGLAQHFPAVDIVYCFPKNIFKRLRLITAIRREKYDVCLNLVFNRSSNIGILANWLVPAGIKIGRFNPNHNFYYNATVELTRGSLPMTDLILTFAARALPVAIRPEARQPSLPLSAENLQTAEKYCLKNKIKAYIVINISAGQPRNIYPRQHWVEVCRLIGAKSRLPLVLIYSPRDRAAAISIVKTCPEIEVSTYDSGPDLLNVAALLIRAIAAVSTDTAIVHFASACGTPVVALYSGKTALWREWVPYGVKHKVLFPGNGADIGTIAPQTVAAALGSLLSPSCTELGKL